MATPIIGYNNLFESGVLSATSEAAGFEKENAIDWLLYDGWKGTSTADQYLTTNVGYGQDADYWAIAGHDLYTRGATIQLEYWTGSAWGIADGPYTPTSNNVIMRTFTSLSSDQWRIKISGHTAAPLLSIVALGVRLAVERNLRVGWAPPLMNSYEVRGNLSEDNATLGRSIITRPFETDVDFTALTQTWVRDNWITFLAHAKAKPFFMLWNSGDYSTEAALYYTIKIVQPPAYSAKQHMASSLMCQVFL